jgi:phosphoribosyl-ATP pyrophosphohydrolase
MIDDVLARLSRTIAARKDKDPASSYTASLLAKGPERCAKKFGEEAVEAALAGALRDRDGLRAEAADVLYHLAVLLAANDLDFGDVAEVLIAREGVSGHAEKAARPTG